MYIQLSTFTFQSY